MTLFAKSLPLDLVMRIWDIYLHDGIVTIYRVALTILGYRKDVLLKEEFAEILKYLKRPSTVLNFEEKLFFETLQHYRVPSKKIKQSLINYNLEDT